MLEALWTEETLPFPDRAAETNWELWLRRQPHVDHLERLKRFAPEFDLVVQSEAITFVDRTIVIVRGSANNLSRSIDILAMLAELQLPKITATFFSEMRSKDQHEWIDDMRARLTAAPANSPYVCLLDSGLNAGHPLLAPIADQADLHAYKSAWGVDDRKGHGTPMAELAAYGDLSELLASRESVALSHRLEFVKIINDADPHEPALYGAVTQESAYRVESVATRRRVFCMAVTAEDGRDRGRPSSWSAAVDSLAFGDEDTQSRLFILSAGNTDPSQRRLYADSNLTDSIHDPAQAWNALTVGGCTEKYAFDAAAWPGWQPLAQIGDLAPCSCTSTTWGKWAIKPDIVMEAGNMRGNPTYADPDYLDDLQLLSTSHQSIARPPLTTFGDTSAAAALAARLAATVWHKYPTFTPETIRALMIHSAEWTPAMRSRFMNARGDVNYKNLVRCFGHGVPNLRRLLSSLDNSLTLVAEGEIQPFFKEDGRVKTREMVLHDLPWPIDELAGVAQHPRHHARHPFLFHRAKPRRAGLGFALRLSIPWSSICGSPPAGDTAPVRRAYQ